MATFMGTTFTGTALDAAATPPYAKASGAKSRAKKRSSVESFTLASQASGSTLVIGKMPVGAVFAGVKMTTDTSLGSSTVAIGISGSTAKYKAAATFTATDTPTEYGKAAARDDVLTAEETVIATIAAADLPSSGTLVFELSWLEPA